MPAAVKGLEFALNPTPSKRLGTAGKPKILGKEETKAAIEVIVKQQQAVMRECKESALASQAVSRKKGIHNRRLVILIPFLFNDAAALIKQGRSLSLLGQSHWPPQERLPSPSLGGLNNEDIVSMKLQYTAMYKPAAGLLLLTCKNELIEVVDNSEDDSSPIKVSKSTKPHPPTIKPFIVKWEPKIAALPISQPRKKVKLECTPSLSGLASSSASNFTPPSSDNVKGMPTFLTHKWQRQIIPALYQALNASLMPLDMGLQGPVTVKLLQSVINNVCSGNTYKVQWNQSGTTQSGSTRLMECQSAIGNAGIEVVSTFINNKPQLVDQYTEIARYARYAMKHPAFFKIPTPPKAIDVQDKKSPLYVKSKGYLESKMFIETLPQFIKSLNEHHPKGTLALIAASLERSWNSYKTSLFESQGQFSKTTAGASYMVSIDKLSDATWEHILSACNEKTHQVIVVQSNDNDKCLNGHHKDFYEPSSP
ncbi:hypothetical protein C8J57DRAFT_1533263 [Mycena rebaudengoi]|nr:hypothetical protein C8J57DRAFT_1533263 [Mycena rebaudengoi]